MTHTPHQARQDHHEQLLRALVGPPHYVNVCGRWQLVAADRDEADPCQAGTPGCCIDHRDDDACETW